MFLKYISTKRKGVYSMLQKAMKYLKWGQTALRFVPKTKNAYGVLKRFLPKKKKKQKKNKKRILKNVFHNIKKSIIVIKEYCIYINKIFLILKER
jgi:hypothetical protein